MEDQITINEFGYSEMYEWANVPDHCRFGRFVQFDDNYPNLIKLAENTKDLVGVTTINAIVTANTYDDYWYKKYRYDEYGDLYALQKTVGVGYKDYDSVNELPYIRTKKEIVYTPILNKEFDETKKYVSRADRLEWIRVNLLGKCIVEDFGTCTNSRYCKLYSGNDKNLYGTVVPASDNENCLKWIILNRVSDKTIMIFYK